MTGAAIGTAWAAGLRATGMPSHATLSVVGDDSAQLVLLDTTNIRVLIVLGTPSSDLVDRVPAVMTVLRQRLDLVIAQESTVGSLGEAFTSRWAVRHHLIIPTSIATSLLPDLPDRTRVMGDMSVDLANDCRLELRGSPRQEWFTAHEQEPHGLWSVTLRQARNVVILAPDTSAAVATSTARPSLVVAPGADADLVLSKVAPGAIAMNADHLDGVKGSAAFLRTYLDEIARIGLREEGIMLPPWAEQR
jgi:hypothetical protein